jgi:hypothetical protein
LLSNWLSPKAKSSTPYKKFVVFEIDEKVQMDQEARHHLVKLVQNARCDPKIYDDFVVRLGWTEARKLLADQTQPTNQKMRKGFFGEVLICAILTEFFGYLIPVEKWRYAITANQSLPGTDAIAIKADANNIYEVCFVESKTRITNDTMAGVMGYRQLKDDHSKRIPDMIFFAMCRLQERNDPLYNAFLNYVFDRRDLSGMETFCLGLTWDISMWTEKALQNLEEEIGNSQFPRLVVNRILIKDLVKQINELFGTIEIGELLDDDD